MSKRLLILIATESGEHDETGMSVDIASYRKFFMSDEGGAWDKDEIIEFNEDRPFSHTILDSIVPIAEEFDVPIDYVVFVFCGHGSLMQNGSVGVYLNNQSCLYPVCGVIRAFSNTRALMIFDSCQGEWSSDDEEITRYFSIVEGMNKVQGNRKKCRELYDSVFMSNPIGSYQIGYAVSPNEYANGSEDGGVYSQTLLSVALRSVSNCISIEDPALSFEEIHKEAACEVTNRRPDQHPRLSGTNGVQFPFVIFPSTRLRLF